MNTCKITKRLTVLLVLATTQVILAGQWNYTDHTLHNGLRVIVMEDHSAPIAAIQVWYHVGSKDEQPDRTGFAHMFEHMMFRGTDRIGPEDHFKYLRRFGGNVNGYTAFDQTVYIQEVPSNQVDLTFWLEAERMARLKITEDYFHTEREVVKEEFRLGVSDPPYGTLPNKVLPFVFGQHPYAWTPIGNLDHLNAAATEELQTFWNTYYVPNNATLVVVGDVKTDTILKKAKDYFGWIPRSPDPPQVTIVEPPVTEPRRLDIPENKGPLAIVGIAHRVCNARDKDRHALAVLDRVLSGGESGRVYKKLVKDLEVAMFAMSGTFTLEQDGLWALGAVVKMGSTPEEVESALIEQLDLVLASGITESELVKARNQIAAQTVQGQTTVSGKAQKLGYAAVVQDDISIVNREYAEMMAVSREDVLQAARKYFNPQSRMTLVVRPVSLTSKALNWFGKLGGKKNKTADESQPKSENKSEESSKTKESDS